MFIKELTFLLIFCYRQDYQEIVKYQKSLEYQGLLLVMMMMTLELVLLLVQLLE